MICKKCSTENSENAVFCQHCGKRLDGKVVCPSCQTLNEEQANFCLSCGYNLNDVTVCSECGETYRGKFCPKCGTPALPAACAVQPQYAVQKTAKPSVWRKALEYVAGGLAMAAIFFALLFTFLIGLSIDLNGGGVEEIAALKNANCSIYYYFGDVYEEIDAAINAVSEYDEAYSLSQLLPAILGTLVAAATIITVVTFTALALARYLKKVLGKSEKDYASFTAMAVFSYLAGTVAFKSLSAVAMSGSSGGVTVQAGIGYNAATIAGIVLSVIFLAAFLGCRIAINAKCVWQKKRLVTLCLSAGGVLLFGLALQFLGGVLASVKISQMVSWSSNVKMTIGGGYTILIEMLYTDIKQYVGGSLVMTFTEEEFIILLLALIGLVVQIACTVLTAIATVKHACNLAGDKGKGALTFAIIAEVLALTHLVLVIVTTKQYAEYAKMTEGYKWNYAPAICGFIFTTLAFAATIVHKVFLKQEPKEELQA